jgi:hypothetical protein
VVTDIECRKIRNKLKTGYVPSSAATQSASGSLVTLVSSRYSDYSLLSLSVLLPLQVLRLQCDETTVQQNLSVQFGCWPDAVVFSAI